jgi:hypothetical protein
MTYTFVDSIEKLKTDSDGNVIAVHWNRVATDSDGYSATYVGRTPLPEANTASNTYINFSDLTESAVLQWAVGQADANNIMSSIDKTIELQKINDTPLPWKETDELVEPENSIFNLDPDEI